MATLKKVLGQILRPNLFKKPNVRILSSKIIPIKIILFFHSNSFVFVRVTWSWRERDVSLRDRDRERDVSLRDRDRES